MGYTHYFEANRDFTEVEWNSLMAAAKSIIAETKVPLAWERDEPDQPPEVSDKRIRFNGVDDNGYETFLLTKDAHGFDFCKTARKPYDVVVTAVLSAANAIAPGALDIRSDGDPSDWVAGVGLANDAVTGLKAANPLAGNEGAILTDGGPY